jgi:tRNA dimethylallyltransferase
MVAVTENDWTQHVKSRAHRRAVGIQKKQQNTEYARKERRDDARKELIDVLEDYMATFPASEDRMGQD